MATTEKQAKKDIVAALRALRVILTQKPRREYPDGLGEHPKVKRLLSEIKTALAPHVATLDPKGPYFRDFLTCDVATLEETPAYWETLKELDWYVERFSDKLGGGGANSKWDPYLDYANKYEDEHPDATEKDIRKAYIARFPARLKPGPRTLSQTRYERTNRKR